MAEKTRGELLSEQLVYKQKSAYEVMTADEKKAAEEFAKGYKDYLDKGKTERECVAVSIKMAEANGFVPFERGVAYKAGDKVYKNISNKAVYFYVFGQKSMNEGIRITAAHIDSPRLDLKGHPLYEDRGVAQLKTHYYGGVKKYQWTAIPLALHGVIIKADGTPVNVCIGEDEEDPILYLTDLLPHLAKDQMAQTLREGIKGESMNILIGSEPIEDDKVSEKVKLNILSWFYEKYGVTERDLLTAELTVVPAMKARDVGLDRSFIASYGHDDRVCAYPALMAMFDNPNPACGTLVVLADKEEVGSQGISGMQSRLFTYFIDDLAKATGADFNTVMENSLCLSADVCAAYDVNYPEVHDPRNAPFVNCGIGIAKYVGAGGKGGTNDAPSEYFALIQRIMDKAGVLWQAGEMGKVDQGGGGTVAQYISNQGIRTIDCGVPVLSMHAPYELVSRADVYYTYRAFLAFHAYDAE